MTETNKVLSDANFSFLCVFNLINPSVPNSFFSVYKDYHSQG